MKNFRRLVLTTIIFLLALGCGSWVTAEEPEIVLWIVTERTQQTGMNGIIQEAMENFSREHPRVSFQLEILPVGNQDRARRMEELRELMNQGGGPDIFLLPTRYSANQGLREKAIEPMFPSIPYAMRQGKFLDISQYYDKDETLDSSGLQQAVMDAGCVGGGRFLLPICFSINAFYFMSDELSSELRPDMTILEVMDYGIFSGDPLLAKILTGNSMAMYRPEMIFSSLIDYDTGKVSLSFREAENFFDRFQRLLEIVNEGGTEDYVMGDLTLWWYLKSPASKRVLYPCYLAGLPHVMTLRSISKLEGKTLTVIPLRASDNSVTAMVDYFGAIGASCESPKTAYEFLRTLLLPEYQWRIGETGELVLDGWPVRVDGSVDAMWEKVCERFDSQKTRRQLELLGASDAWVTEITDQITRVEFRVDINLTNSLEQIKTLN